MKKRLGLALLSLVFLLIDQFSKYWAKGHWDIWINSRGSIFFSLLGLGLAAWLIISRKQSRDVGRVATVLLLIGGISNLIDRILWGGVMDIFNISNFSFNLSDGLIVIGAMILLFI